MHVCFRGIKRTSRLERADVLSITMRSNSLWATAISVRFVGWDSACVDIASDPLRVDIASAADLPRGGNTRFRTAHILLSHAGHGQEWRDECDGKDVFDGHDFSSDIYSKVPPAGYRSCRTDDHQRGVKTPIF